MPVPKRIIQEQCRSVPGLVRQPGSARGLAQQGDGIFRKFVFLETSASEALDPSVAGQMGQPNIAGGFAIHEDEHVARHFQPRVHRIDVEERRTAFV